MHGRGGGRQGSRGAPAPTPRPRPGQAQQQGQAGVAGSAPLQGQLAGQAGVSCVREVRPSWVVSPGVVGGWAQTGDTESCLVVPAFPSLP